MALRSSPSEVTEREEKVVTATEAATGRAKVDERAAARHRFERGRTVSGADTVVMTPADTTLAGPRPRASMMATLSLVLGVIGSVAVLTGLLAGPGVAVGLLAVILGIGGVAATGRRHVAGKGDALLGLALGLGAAVLGILAITGMVPWLDGEANMVERAREWTESYLPWLFPTR